MNLTRTVPPAYKPVSLSEAKDHLRVDTEADDTLINGLISVATEQAEGFLRRAIATQTWKLSMDSFREVFLRGPVQSVTSIAYVDEDGATQTLDPSIYTVDTEGQRVFLAYGQSWPSTRSVPNAVSITYVAGYTVIPESIRQGILLLVQSLYDGDASLVDVAYTVMGFYRDMANHWGAQ